MARIFLQSVRVARRGVCPVPARLGFRRDDDFPVSDLDGLFDERKDAGENGVLLILRILHENGVVDLKENLANVSPPYR